jgi:diaminopimelate epimerase
MPGGQLQITFGEDFQVSMSGPVQKIGRLTLDEDCFTGGDDSCEF